jgi:hypothetical protein
MNWFLIFLVICLCVALGDNASAAEVVTAPVVGNDLGLTFFFIGLSAMCASGWFCCHQSTMTAHSVKAKWKIVRTPDDFWQVYRKGRFTGIWWLQHSFAFEDTAQRYLQNKIHPKTTIFDSNGEPIG